MDRSGQVTHQASIHTRTSTYTYTASTGSTGAAVGILHTTVAAHRRSGRGVVMMAVAGVHAGISTAMAKYCKVRVGISTRIRIV